MFYDVFDEMSNLFDDFGFSTTKFTAVSSNPKSKYSVPAFPPVRIVQRDNKISFKFALAGYEKKDIELNFKKDYLVLSTAKEFNEEALKKKVEDSKIMVDNFKTPNFSYKYFVPSDRFDFEKVEAKFDNGVLFITIPNKEKTEPKVKKVEIK